MSATTNSQSVSRACVDRILDIIDTIITGIITTRQDGRLLNKLCITAYDYAKTSPWPPPHTGLTANQLTAKSSLRG